MMIPKIFLSYFTKDNKVTKQLSNAASLMIVGEDGSHAIVDIDMESMKNVLPKVLGRPGTYQHFTEKEWAAFNKRFDWDFDDDIEEGELKTAAAAGEKFKIDSGYAR